MPTPTVEQLLRAATRSAKHLEMRDGYMLDDPSFITWQREKRVELDAGSQAWRAAVSDATHRGVRVQRARVFSTPASDYLRFEYEYTTSLNQPAGEDVRWLPRRQGTAIALPGNDFWLFDDETLLVLHFAGNGDWEGTEIDTRPAAVNLCRNAFEEVWRQAVPHEDYSII